MSFTFSKSSRCLLRFSVTIQDDLDRHAVDEEACNPLFDDACGPTDMTFFSMRSIIISSMDFSTALRLLDIHTCDQMFRIVGQTLKVSRIGGDP
jgi:hypothetical protein